MSTDVFDIAKISTSTGFHLAVGPAPDTSLPSFAGDCPAVHSYYPTSMSPIEMLCDEVEKGSIERVYILDEAQLPFDPTYVKKLHRNENGRGHEEFVVEGQYGGASPFDPSSRKDILRMIETQNQKLRYKIHLLCVNVNSLVDARHIHGLCAGDEAEYVREICALVS